MKQYIGKELKFFLDNKFFPNKNIQCLRANLDNKNFDEIYYIDGDYLEHDENYKLHEIEEMVITEIELVDEFYGLDDSIPKKGYNLVVRKTKPRTIKIYKEIAETNELIHLASASIKETKYDNLYLTNLIDFLDSSSEEDELLLAIFAFEYLGFYVKENTLKTLKLIYPDITFETKGYNPMILKYEEIKNLPTNIVINYKTKNNIILRIEM